MLLSIIGSYPKREVPENYVRGGNGDGGNGDGRGGGGNGSGIGSSIPQQRPSSARGKGKLKRRRSTATAAKEPTNGIERFLYIWIKLPPWWNVNHDMLLLELALKHKLNTKEYVNDLKHDDFYENWVEQLEKNGEGRIFTQWCQDRLNVVHRLRFLIYVIVHQCSPDSTVFLNEVMVHSHLDYLRDPLDSLLDDDISEKKDKHDVHDANDSNDSNDANTGDKNGSEDESEEEEQKVETMPVGNIEGEFRDVVQLLEPEMFGPRIWSYIMEQIHHKQRESLWCRALSAAHFPSCGFPHIA